MCITAPAQVVGIDQAWALVSIDGRQRRASTAVVPEVAIGDWVIVGAGTILRRLSQPEARDLLDTIDVASAEADRRARSPGGQS